MALLELENLNVYYGAIQALHGVSMNVETGEIVTLIGANGAGKSTILRTISGLLKPLQGTITYDGRPLVGCAPHAIVRAGLSHVPEGRGIFANLTVDENLRLGAYARRDQAQIRIDQERSLTLFPRLKERLHQNAGTLSGGEQQMLAIGRALMARPRLLLLDEPSLGMAPQIVQTIFKIIQEINQQGTTILLVEQNAHMALQISRRAYVLEVGNIKLQGESKDLQQNDQVRRAYLGGS